MASPRDSGIFVFPMSIQEKIVQAENSGDELLQSEIDSFPYVEISLVRESLVGQIDQGNNFKTLCIFTPQSVQNSDGVSYGSTDLGNVGAIVQRVAELGVEGAIKSLNASDVKEIGAQSMADLGTSIAPSISGAIQVTTRAIKNPNTTTTLDGVSLRGFSINIKLTPESKEESDRIRKIENMLRYYMYPLKEGGEFGRLKYPATFRVKFMYGSNENKYLPFYHDAFIESLNVNYNPDSTSYHKGGAPNSVDITISFKEAFVLTRDDLFFIEENQGLSNSNSALRDTRRNRAYAASQALERTRGGIE